MLWYHLCYDDLQTWAINSVFQEVIPGRMFFFQKIQIYLSFYLYISKYTHILYIYIYICIHIHIYGGIMVKGLTADDGTLTPTDDSARVCCRHCRWRYWRASNMKADWPRLQPPLNCLNLARPLSSPPAPAETTANKPVWWNSHSKGLILPSKFWSESKCCTQMDWGHSRLRIAAGQKGETKRTVLLWWRPLVCNTLTGIHWAVLRVLYNNISSQYYSYVL